MSDKNDELDFDNMSDEDFLKVSEEDALRAIDTQKPSDDEHLEVDSENQNEEEEENNSENEENSDDGNGQSDEEFNKAGQPNDNQETSSETDANNEQNNESDSDESKTDEENSENEDGKQSKSDSKKEGQKADKLPDGVTVEQATTAVEFMKQVTAPFRADGKDFQVRSTEDVIRLMQQGVNYSRRMQELKPMKALNRMLTDHGLNDENKLSFAIDLLKGDKNAITKLLKENKIDPIDLDLETENKYQTKNYAGTPQQNAFRDALDNAITNPEGQALVTEIHKTWDDASKKRLREEPSVLGNLVELRKAGIYQQVVDELDYQRSMGYLTDIPWLQAFDQVGEAMKNAGVLKLPNAKAPPATPDSSMGQFSENTQNNRQPVASGGRKAQKPKKSAPNPHLSSTPPSKQTGNTQSSEIDFDKLSDEEFLKMAPPS